MGGPKSDLTLEGRPILERLFDRLNWPGPTILVTAPGREHPAGWQRFTREATDPIAGQGPMRGVLTALESASTDEVVVIPVDMPNVTSNRLAWLAGRLRETAEAAAIMLMRYGRTEPLPAAFRPVAAEHLLRAHLAEGRLALHSLTETPEVIVIPEPPDWPSDFWLNLNTPSDLASHSAGARSP